MDERLVKLGEECPINEEDLLEMKTELHGLRSAVLSMQERHVFITKSSEAFEAIRHCILFITAAMERKDFPQEKIKTVRHSLVMMKKWFDFLAADFPELDG